MQVKGRVAGSRARVIAVRQQHVGADVHIAAPELAQHLATHLDELHAIAVARVALLQHLAVAQWLDRRNDLVDHQFDAAARRRVDPYTGRCAVGVAGGAKRLLSGSGIQMHLNNVSVVAFESRVHAQERLNDVFSRRDGVEARQRIADNATLGHRAR